MEVDVRGRGRDGEEREEKANLEGKKIRSWRFGKVLGEGMCGVVYSAETDKKEKVSSQGFTSKL